MGFITDNILALILLTPILVAAVLLFLPKENQRLLKWVALIGSLIPFALSLYLWFSFHSTIPGFQFETKRIWYGVVGSSFHLGVDGLSLTMVLLTTLLTPIAILASFSVTERLKPYLILFMLLETGMLGVFLSLDLLLFFVFWEVMLIPMYFLVGVWGGERRIYAAWKLILYTMTGSLLMLVAILYLVTLHNQQSGQLTFDLLRLYDFSAH